MNINRKISKYNFNKGSVSRIKYIVIHYVGALGGAEDNCRYYGGGNRNASAHYFVGFNGEVWQCVEDANIAWHCGASSYKHAECRRGTQLKIGNDIAYANYIEDKIVNEDYSPAAVLGELKAQGKEGDFSVTVCVTTLYSYIDKGIFLKLSNKNLPVKKNKKRNYKKVQRQQKRAAAGESIDKRPKEIDTREEFGNWEMDSVLGKRGKSKNTLLVLTERKTRNEIIFKLPDHTDEAVVAALDRLERKWGADMFKRVFKTITVDNGSEFADAEGLQRSIINEGEKRTKVYYCHPYSSWERGTNEVTNKMIRRKIPKGTNFDDRTEEEVESIENWINGYPRKIHGYHSAGELFEEEVKQLA